MKNILLITFCFAFSCLSFNVNAQNERKPKKSDDSRFMLLKKESTEKPKNKGVSSEAKPINKVTTPSKTSGQSKVNVAEPSSTLKEPVPATRMSSTQEKKSINNKVNPALSDIDNLFNLMEEKENVSKYGNSSLLNSDDYKVLNNNIIELKSNFNKYIVKKGIQNCSEKEQNFYLASLKEDGKKEEYKNNVELIKSSK
jgi:hypothetical protein